MPDDCKTAGAPDAVPFARAGGMKVVETGSCLERWGVLGRFLAIARSLVPGCVNWRMSYPSRFGILARKGRQIFVVPAKAGTQSLPLA